MTTIVVIAKEPVPGRVKTRLCPPCTAVDAAVIADAAIADTLAAAMRVAPTVIALDGRAGPWVPRGIRVIPQSGRGLDERIANAFSAIDGPALLIGMDTPQVSPALLRSAVDTLERPGVDAVLGCAEDGGWWAAGLHRPDPRAFVGVPMSTAHTYVAQLRRLRSLRLRVRDLPALRDVDTLDDAVAVSRRVPGTRFAAAVEAVTSRLTTSSGRPRQQQVRTSPAPPEVSATIRA